MIIKIIIEIILCIILLGISATFWDCIKSIKFMANFFRDYEELKRVYQYYKEKIIKGSTEIKPLPISENPNIGFEYNVVLLIQSSITTLDKTRNMLLVFIVGIFIGSYFLGNVFLFINIGMFIIMAFRGISASAKNNIVSDIYAIMLNVYKWNMTDPSECEKSCNTNWKLKNIYRVITEEN